MHKTKSKPKPTCKFKNCSHVYAYHCAQLSYTTQHRTVLIIFPPNLLTQFLWVLLGICTTDCSQCSLRSLGSSTHAGCQNTLLHCFRNYTGYASRSASSSGCVFWHITVCMAQHQRIWQTACGRHQMSSLVVVFLLSTARRC